METTIAYKLDNLVKIQDLDSRLDKAKKIQGDLPEEVRELDDQIEGFRTRISNLNKNLEQCKLDIQEGKRTIKEAEDSIRYYEEQQMEVRNNREFEAILKQIEIAKLDTQLGNKKIREKEEEIEELNQQITLNKEKLVQSKEKLESKKNDLSILIKETEEEELHIHKERDIIVKSIDERLYNSYMKIRNNSVNGFAIVSVIRSACGGCFNLVPPQRQVEVKERRKDHYLRALR